MKTFVYLVRRNCKLFFKDKMMFFVSLITPIILLVLYVAFLANTFKSAFQAGIPPVILDNTPAKLLDGMVGGQLLSSLLAVSPVTVSLCCSLICVQDKNNGAIQDLSIAPIKKSTLAMAYFVSTFVATFLVCIVAMCVCLIYIAIIGWYYTIVDILLLLLDVFILTLFGTAFSSLIDFFIHTEGQSSAIGTIICSMYGFICGAYMPLSQMPAGLRNVAMFLPGTHATSLMREHAMGAHIKEMANLGWPSEVGEGIRSSVDMNIFIFGNEIPMWAKYIVIISTIAVLVGIYILLYILQSKNILKPKGEKKSKKSHKKAND